MISDNSYIREHSIDAVPLQADKLINAIHRILLLIGDNNREILKQYSKNDRISFFLSSGTQTRNRYSLLLAYKLSLSLFRWVVKCVCVVDDVEILYFDRTQLLVALAVFCCCQRGVALVALSRLGCICISVGFTNTLLLLTADRCHITRIF